MSRLTHSGTFACNKLIFVQCLEEKIQDGNQDDCQCGMAKKDKIAQKSLHSTKIVSTFLGYLGVKESKLNISRFKMAAIKSQDI